MVKGPVANATVTIKNAATGAVLATGGTNASGNYTLSVSQTSGDLVVEVSGGSYVDEATGATATLSAPMRSVVTANGGQVTGVVTPLTTMAYTYAFGTATTGVTASAFNTKAASVASQFQLNGVNLATTVPVISGSLNTYGQVLRGISQYLQTQSISLPTFTNATYDLAQWAAFTTTFNNAYRLANPGGNITFNFDGNGLVVGGTGGGGGSGSCGVHVTGTITAQGFTVPLNLNYCIAGIAAGSCSAGNASLSQAISGAGGVAGAANLSYTYSPTCAPGALTITLQ